MRRILLGAVICIVASCESGPTARREAVSPSVPVPTASVESQIAALEKASQPGLSHKELASLRGSWDVHLVDVTIDGTEAEIAQGTATIRAEYGGRFLRWDTTMIFGGTPHDTTGFVGYDLGSHEYQSMMINDVSTGMSVAHGTGELARAGIRFTLELVDRSSGARARMSSVLRMIDADHFAQDLLGSDAVGNELVVRRYHYRRRSPSPGTVTK
jgi:hypothetical protein